jgi:nucleoside-diphosphate-sugar epimerase
VSEARGTILVTGSSGFLGYHVARRLTASFAVVGFDRRAPSHPPPTAECLYVDLTTEQSLARGLDAVRDLHGDRLAAVCHFAAYYDFSGAPNPQYEQVTIEGTRRLLRMLRDRFTVEQFVFSSTMLIHAPTVPGRPISEDWPLQPKWAYPESKRRTEEILLHERGAVPVVILRIAGVYNDLGHSVTLPRQIQRIYERTPEAYLFPGDLTHGQAMVHLDDVADLYELLAARRRNLPAELTLLVGEPATIGYGHLQEMIGSQLHGEKWVTRQIPKWLAKAGAFLQDRLPLNGKPYIKPWMIELADDHFELDITRAKTALGWTPTRSLRTSLPKITAALLADPWAWYRENELPMPVWLRETKPAAAPVPELEIEPDQLMQLRELVKEHGIPHHRDEAQGT